MNANTNKVVGLHLRTLRRHLGLSQSEVARRCQRIQSFVSKVEQGERSLLFSEVFMYAKALNITGFELMTGIRDALLESARRQEVGDSSRA